MDNFDGWPVAPVLCISACIIYGLLEMFIERIGLIEKIGKDDIYKKRKIKKIIHIINVVLAYALGGVVDVVVSLAYDAVREAIQQHL